MGIVVSQEYSTLIDYLLMEVNQRFDPMAFVHIV
jgi:hypothetical protein